MRHERILLVEESGPTRRLVRAMLCDLDYVLVEEAPDVETAERLLKSHAFDAILLNWRRASPGSVGFLARLRANESPVVAMTPVIVVTADLDLATLQKAAELGACSVLTKPFSPRQLKSHLETARSGNLQPEPPREAEPVSRPVAFAPRKKPVPVKDTNPLPGTTDPDESEIFYV